MVPGFGVVVPGFACFFIWGVLLKFLFFGRAKRAPTSIVAWIGEVVKFYLTTGADKPHAKC